MNLIFKLILLIKIKWAITDTAHLKLQVQETHLFHLMMIMAIEDKEEWNLQNQEIDIMIETRGAVIDHLILETEVLENKIWVDLHLQEDIKIGIEDEILESLSREMKEDSEVEEMINKKHSCKDRHPQQIDSPKLLQ